MDTIDIDLICRLFAEATARLEEAHGLAVEGQVPGQTAASYRKTASRLGAAAREVVALAEAIAVVTKPPSHPREDSF